MSSLTLSAPAKLNLTLDILGTRPDGYHEMEMVMQSVSLCDEIHLHLGFPGGIRAESGLRFLPNDKGNLAVAAAVAFRQATDQSWTDLRISIEKRIPVCAGTAGGSSDAAAVLRGLNLLTNAGLSLQDLARIGAAVGSDVPYCVLGGTALAHGRGETLTPLPALPGFPSPPLPCFGNGTRKGAISARIPREPWPPWHKGTCWGLPAGRSMSLREFFLPTSTGKSKQSKIP